MTPNPQDSAVALEVELLPCPFCGAHLPEFTRCIAGSNRHRIKCTECPGRAEFFSSTAEQAVAAWNRRASQSDGTSGGWQPIETAPKDGSDVLLYCKGKGVVRGRWNNCRFATLPRPYWTNDREHLWGVLSTRIDQPTHWMNLPAAPNQGENHVG